MSSQISIVCPSYNSESFITDTLNCLFMQTIRPLEVIVSDDGSTDKTCDVVNEFILSHPDFPVRLLSNPHRGPGAARNQGIIHAHGDWIAFIDSDDIWFANKLERVQSAIQNNHTSNFICHNVDNVKVDGTMLRLNLSQHYQENESLFKQLYRRNLFSTSTVTCKKEILLKAGLFDEALMSAQDYELWLRMSSLIQLYFISETLSFYYDRHGNISSRKVLRRMKNITRISFRFRHQVSVIVLLKKLFRANISIMYQQAQSVWSLFFRKLNAE